jgi:hypothetical protein
MECGGQGAELPGEEESAEWFELTSGMIQGVVEGWLTSNCTAWAMRAQEEGDAGWPVVLNGLKSGDVRTQQWCFEAVRKRLMRSPVEGVDARALEDLLEIFFGEETTDFEWLASTGSGLERSDVLRVAAWVLRAAAIPVVAQTLLRIGEAWPAELWVAFMWTWAGVMGELPEWNRGFLEELLMAGVQADLVSRVREGIERLGSVEVLNSCAWWVSPRVMSAVGIPEVFLALGVEGCVPALAGLCALLKRGKEVVRAAIRDEALVEAWKVRREAVFLALGAEKGGGVLAELLGGLSQEEAEWLIDVTSGEFPGFAREEAEAVLKGVSRGGGGGSGQGEASSAEDNAGVASQPSAAVEAGESGSVAAGESGSVAEIGDE